MSHAVTITRTTTTTTTTAITCNPGFLRSVPGILTLFETITNVICVGIMADDISGNYSSSYELYFLLIANAMFITTALILFACILSPGTSTMLPKTMFHYLYHTVGFILYLSAGLILLVKNGDNYPYKEHSDALVLVAAVMGLVNSVLYLISAIMSYRTFYFY
ncbi:hypothetical protein CHUAL_012940 [Chamberlinius hualienensis]